LQSYLETYFFKYICGNDKLDLEVKFQRKLIPDQKIAKIEAGEQNTHFIIQEDTENQIDSELGSKYSLVEKEFLSLNSNGSRAIQFRPGDFDEFGFVKEHRLLSTASPLPYQFYDAGSSYVLQVEMPGFTQEDVDNKKIRIRRHKEEDGKSFSYVVEGIKKIALPESGVKLMKPTMKYGEVICQTGKLMFAKVGDFGEKVTRTLSDGILTVKWTKKELIDDDEI